jgi:hypothetical protein
VRKAEKPEAQDDVDTIFEELHFPLRDNLRVPDEK